MTRPYENSEAVEKIEELKEAMSDIEASDISLDQSLEVEERKEKIAHDIEELEKSRWIVDEKDIEHYHGLSQYLYVPWRFSIRFDDGMRQYLNQLLAGNIDINAYIELCNKRVEMILSE